MIVLTGPWSLMDSMGGEVGVCLSPDLGHLVIHLTDPLIGLLIQQCVEIGRLVKGYFFNMHS